ncbi:protein-L-isoaspartate O-methyltransferase [Hansschlegelia quercus]|uniref:Protein-L-isoaspartate O-methyltransferase n=1 Tax=Hansschlegelia quercus TaxID=2528245 RepID=A0A4Q9GR44_9HYPH|nr:protein-L-isoaspartate O-methyltransferase [Hansschlegelia quercus]TBN54207.1 protein-L-isoaspartate O-methyltransferase [Hansschlegelia quercus]
MTDFERLRHGMVDGQIRVADVTDRRVLAAFLSVPKERFCAPGQEDLAYLDLSMPLGPAGRASLEPRTLAKLVQLADPQQGETALVIGCGRGYSAAILAGLVSQVVALECDSGLASAARAALGDLPNVVVEEGPLPEGAPGSAPFDMIFVDGAVVDGYEALGAQLSAHGRMVAPAGFGRATKATVFRKAGTGLSTAQAFDAGGPLLPGFEAREAFAL